MSLRYLSVCSGIEAATVAWHPLGFVPVAFAEIEKFPSAVLAHHYPDVPNIGDMRNALRDSFNEYVDVDDPFDLLVGGTPCFPEHVLIATERGLIPISQVRVGDSVLTHKHRWRRVLRTGSKISDTVIVRGQGLTDGLHTTPDHPIYGRKYKNKWVRSADDQTRPKTRRLFEDPDWIRAEAMKGCFWAQPTQWPTSSVPEVEHRGREHPVIVPTEALLRLAGRWVADGWTRINDRKGYAFIACGKHKVDVFTGLMENTGLTYSIYEHPTIYRCQISSRPLARWLQINFGVGAAHKTLPTWLFGLPEQQRRAFLDGYLGGDGYATSYGYRCSTVSRSLALGISLLACSLGHSVSRRLVQPRATTSSICGRDVTARPYYQCTIYDSSRSSFEDKGHRWGLVRAVEPSSVSRVYDLEVEEDHSYVADGIVVHNCQSFSVAGLRGGLHDDRGQLALVFCQIAARYRPKWILWENVPGALSADKGEAFSSITQALSQLGYDLAWRVLDAQYVRVDGYPRAVPQRRRRVFLVGCLRGRTRAAAVLFDRESLSGNSPPRREARQTIAGSLTASSGGCDENDAADGRLITHTPDVSMCLNAGAMNRIDAESETLLSIHLRSRRDSGLIPFDETQITSLTNRSQPRPGDPSHPLAAQARPPTIAFHARQDPDYGEVTHPLDTDGTSIGILTSSNVSEVSFATSKKTDAGALLYRVRNALGEEAFAEWGLGILDTLQPAEVLRSALYGSELRPATFSRRWVVYCALSCEKDRASGALQSLWEAAGEGCSSQRWELSEQLLGELGTYLSELSQPGAQATRFMCDLWCAAQEFGILRQTLSAVQEIRRSAFGEDQSASSNWRVRRLTPEEAEFLQGFPRGYTAIPFRNRLIAADGPRYKALGNSMAIPVMRWIGERILAVHNLP